jgi:hypothetical protein
MRDVFAYGQAYISSLQWKCLELIFSLDVDFEDGLISHELKSLRVLELV